MATTCRNQPAAPIGIFSGFISIDLSIWLLGLVLHGYISSSERAILYKEAGISIYLSGTVKYNQKKLLWITQLVTAVLKSQSKTK
jgi:hypothetical protein